MKYNNQICHLFPKLHDNFNRQEITTISEWDFSKLFPRTSFSDILALRSVVRRAPTFTSRGCKIVLKEMTPTFNLISNLFASILATDFSKRRSKAYYYRFPPRPDPHERK